MAAAAQNGAGSRWTGARTLALGVGSEGLVEELFLERHLLRAARERALVIPHDDTLAVAIKQHDGGDRGDLSLRAARTERGERSRARDTRRGGRGVGLTVSIPSTAEAARACDSHAALGTWRSLQRSNLNTQITENSTKREMTPTYSPCPTISASLSRRPRSTPRAPCPADARTARPPRSTASSARGSSPAAPWRPSRR